MLRKPAVAGYFYPAERHSVLELINSFGAANDNPKKAFGVVAPHAGYIYSGKAAAKVYASVIFTQSIILIGPNHGSGRIADSPTAAIMSSGTWESPLGDVPVDEDLAKCLLSETPLLEDAPRAHETEHSLEVQIPFLLKERKDIRIVPIILARTTKGQIIELAEGIYNGIRKSGKEVALVASTDFSHYIPHKKAEVLDRKAIDKIIAMDAQGLVDVVLANHISMCGVFATAVVMEVCKRLGATHGELLDYRTSGDASGDYDSVVGYGGLAIR